MEEKNNEFSYIICGEDDSAFYFIVKYYTELKGCRKYFFDGK